MSRTTTLAPVCAACHAAAEPEGPPPAMTRSYRCVMKLVSSIGDVAAIVPVLRRLLSPEELPGHYLHKRVTAWSEQVRRV